MFSKKHRHRCTRCGSTRSTRFHRRYPAGPNHPEAKGVCRRCRIRGDVIEVQIHHHHHHHHGWPQEPDEARPRGRGSRGAHPHIAHSIMHPSSAAYPRISPAAAEPPPVYSELPDSQSTSTVPRVERVASHGSPPREPWADLRETRQQPAGVLKPVIKHLGGLLGRLFGTPHE
ncbi:hypothetical protein F5B22DRAFT_255149 [Xylaria bambusicola]|uniref:uncharacterized protein n=1 Tax=Xylaria bambusicola TaxID=326684 RepID=UPI0020073710|nr:uncharacterized protein F5B22DRAFT_255149 [Xylaria bambusicola]KAI0525817.1 hypothetical protein F5B22DRAFT_255149 [Xylaria bambusicola]